MKWNTRLPPKEYNSLKTKGHRSQWPRGLRRRSATARLLGVWIRIPPGTWMSVCCECCVMSGRGLCDELITRLEEPYRLWCVVVVLSRNVLYEEALVQWGLLHQKKKNKTAGETNKWKFCKHCSRYLKFK